MDLHMLLDLNLATF